MKNTNSTSKKSVDEKYNSEFAKRLRHLTESRKPLFGGSKDLAEYLGVSTQQISNYKNGVNMPSISVLCEIAKFYSVSVDYLLGLAESRSSKELDREIHDSLGLSDEAIWHMQAEIKTLCEAANTNSIDEALQKQKKARQFFLGRITTEKEKIAFARKLGLAEKNGQPETIIDSLVTLVHTPSCVTINTLLDEVDIAQPVNRELCVLEALEAIFESEYEALDTSYAIIKIPHNDTKQMKFLSNEQKQFTVSSDKIFNYLLLDLERALQDHRKKHKEDGNE